MWNGRKKKIAEKIGVIVIRRKKGWKVVEKKKKGEQKVEQKISQ